MKELTNCLRCQTWKMMEDKKHLCPTCNEQLNHMHAKREAREKAAMEAAAKAKKEFYATKRANKRLHKERVGVLH